MRIKKYLSPAGALNKRYTDKDFEGTGWHYIPRSDIKPDDKLLGTALKQGEEYYLAGEDGYLLPSNIVNNFLKNKDLNSYFTLQYDANDRIGQLMRLRAADRKANQLTPGAGTFVVAPVAATLAGIGGATLAPFLAPGTIGGNIIGTTAFGEALNQAMKYGTGKTLGEHAVNAAHYLGIPLSQWGDFGILMVGDLPFYVTGDLVGKQVANAGRTLTKEALDQLALDNTFKGIPINPTTKDLAKAINESVDKQSLYTPSILHKFDNPYQITKVSGDKIRLRLPSHTQEKPREVVLVPHGNNLYELHIRTWDGDHVPANLNPQEKTALFESVYNELPEGAEILFPESSADYPATRGTVAALTHLSRDPRFQRGNTTGTLTYTDKNGNLQTFTGNSFIKRLTKPAQILKEPELNDILYNSTYGPTFTTVPTKQDIQTMRNEFQLAYPKIEFKPAIGEYDHSKGFTAYKFGDIGLNDTTKAFSNVMRNRFKNYRLLIGGEPIDESSYLHYKQSDGNLTFHSLDGIFDPLKRSKQSVYIPSKDTDVVGFHTYLPEENWIRYNPDTKSYVPTLIHEVYSHGTDDVARGMIDEDKLLPILESHETIGNGVYTVDETTGDIVPHSLYEQLSNPLNIYADETKITGDALRDYEARASNWEMIGRIYNQIAKQKNITPQEAFKLPESEFLKYVDNMSDHDILNLLWSTNGYTHQYAQTINSTDAVEANKQYIALWRNALKYFPSLILGGYGLSKLNQPTSNRKGGKLIPRKFLFKGNH